MVLKTVQSLKNCIIFKMKGQSQSGLPIFKTNRNTNPTIDKIAAADMILFATPVYWLGMSAQLKLIIDKCYCRGLQLKNKKVGTIVVGGSPVDSIQYELIDKQFDCMAKYLSWDMLFNKSYYATARDELEKNKNSMNELEGIGKNL